VVPLSNVYFCENALPTLTCIDLSVRLLLSTLGSYRPDALPVAQPTVSEYLECDVPKVGSLCISLILYSNELYSEVSQGLASMTWYPKPSN